MTQQGSAFLSDPSRSLVQQWDSDAVFQDLKSPDQQEIMGNAISFPRGIGVSDRLEPKELQGHYVPGRGTLIYWCGGQAPPINYYRVLAAHRFLISGKLPTGRKVDILLIYTLFLPRGKVRPADKLQPKAATILPLVGVARSKQDPINRGHSAQCWYRPPPARAKVDMCETQILQFKTWCYHSFALAPA